MEPIAYILRFQTKMNKILELEVLVDDYSEVGSHASTGGRLERVPLRYVRGKYVQEV